MARGRELRGARARARVCVCVCVVCVCVSLSVLWVVGGKIRAQYGNMGEGENGCV
jgi:hypothetical protein